MPVCTTTTPNDVTCFS